MKLLLSLLTFSVLSSTSAFAGGTFDPSTATLEEIEVKCTKLVSKASPEYSKYADQTLAKKDNKLIEKQISVLTQMLSLDETSSAHQDTYIGQRLSLAQEYNEIKKERNFLKGSLKSNDGPFEPLSLTIENVEDTLLSSANKLKVADYVNLLKAIDAFSLETDFKYLDKNGYIPLTRLVKQEFEALVALQNSCKLESEDSDFKKGVLLETLQAYQNAHTDRLAYEAPKEAAVGLYPILD